VTAASKTLEKKIIHDEVGPEKDATKAMLLTKTKTINN